MCIPEDGLCSHCAAFSFAIVWPAGQETHKSLPSLSHRKSNQATPLRTFQQHPPHHQRTLKSRLRDPFESCQDTISTPTSLSPSAFACFVVNLKGLRPAEQQEWQRKRANNYQRDAMGPGGSSSDRCRRVSGPKHKHPVSIPPQKSTQNHPLLVDFMFIMASRLTLHRFCSACRTCAWQ